ncbi:PREDICTED: uncharacterized protein LOC108446348 [Corvus brachyrhynchos]|uniref:uncharacterized protein LOC108446348 n=1 Tax=Corvus brachyrhynchos TaxID=85066 RepID=UPI00081660F8|nr:PREDICTED: uncharacterized protein LOC108446348 [Corvus brachyrhynchos]
MSAGSPGSPRDDECGDPRDHPGKMNAGSPESPREDECGIPGIIPPLDATPRLALTGRLRPPKPRETPASLCPGALSPFIRIKLEESSVSLLDINLWRRWIFLTAGPGFFPRRRRSLLPPHSGVRRGRLFPLRPESRGNETTASAPAPPCLHLPDNHVSPRCHLWCPPAGGMQQSLPPYEVLPADVSMEELPRSTTVMVEETQPPPRDPLVWSLFTTLYGNFCCLGLLAFVFSVKSRDRKVLGDYSGALSYGSTAKYLNITALVINILIVIIVVTVVALIVSGAIGGMHRYPYGPT